MDTERIALAVLILLPFVLVGEGLLAIAVWRLTGHAMPRLLQGQRGGGSLERPVIGVEAIAAWLALSAVTMAVAFMILFVGEYALLFTLGTGAAMVGLIGSIVLLASPPIVWALVILRRSGRR